ncbi:MAG: UDP-N-acetylmuramate:L-alanyl-gamma-D-glutamyl-meso-diaminopimelate ligase [Pseudomonadota bacterium]|jgi:UDP-N-acetylmuramate: L-alanyl-gamma-D-glutamyl-meso-diaminopimelate ligase
MRIHIVAVSGTGMGPLAGLLRSMGHEVTGSDVAFDPPIGPRLVEWGIQCLKGFDPAHLAYGPDLVVIGNLCRSNNPEARFAIDSGVPYTHIGGALQRFVLPGTRPVIIAGTHGKTTTSSLTAGLLEAAGLKPGFLIGGVPQGLERSFRAPPTERSLLRPARAPFVIEGDEYDTAFFEKTAKFLHYAAELVVLTSIEHDHIDIYPTLEDYLVPFTRLVRELPETGLVVANAADEHVVRIVRERARCPVIWYALQGQETFGVAPHWLVAPSAADATGSSFDLFLGGVAAGRWVTPLMGRHNLANVAAALAVTSHGFGVNPMSLRTAVTELRGAARRQDLLGTPDGVAVYDDFAHHPTAVRETLLGFRERHPRARLFAVFEPRSATACRNLHQDVYPDALAVADGVLLAPVARELPPDQALDVARVAREVGERGRWAGYFPTVDEIVRALAERAQPGDVIAVLSNGTFGGIHQKLVSALEQRALARGSAGVLGSRPEK